MTNLLTATLGGPRAHQGEYPGPPGLLHHITDGHVLHVWTAMTRYLVDQATSGNPETNYK